MVTTSGITSKNKRQKYVPVGNYPEGRLVVQERPVRRHRCLPGLSSTLTGEIGSCVPVKDASTAGTCYLFLLTFAK